MAEYFKYNTDYNNTLVDRSDTTFSPVPPYGEILSSYYIVPEQELYYYRESGGEIVLNDPATIAAYLESSAPPIGPVDNVQQYEFTGYTTTNDNNITYLSGQTDTKIVWKNIWTGGTYNENDMVRDGTWTMIANTDTSDIPSPQQVGPERYLYYPLTPTGTTTNARQLVVGMQYSGTTGYWINGYRVHVTAGNYY